MALVGRITKASTDISRVRVDFTSWLDGSETLDSITYSAADTDTSGWSVAPPPFPALADPTPLEIQSIELASGDTIVEMFLTDGSPGVTYTVTFIARGASGREQTCYVGVNVSGIPSTDTEPTVLLADGGVSILGDTMGGRLYLYDDPLASAEAATKRYVDAQRNDVEDQIADEAAARNAQIVAEAAARDVAIAVETSARTAADTADAAAWTAAVAAEASTRATADTTEATTRAAADTAEVTNRNTAISTAVSTAIATEVTNRNTAIATSAAADAVLLAAAVAALRIVGTIIDFAGSTTPAGYLVCNGDAISRTGYAELFAVLGVTWGAGDAITTFNIPDFRGRVRAMGDFGASRLTSTSMGVSAVLGVSAGSELLHGHTHVNTLTDPGHTHTIVTGSEGLGSGVTWSNTTGSTALTQSNTTGVTINNASAGTGTSQNVQPTSIVNTLIRYTSAL